MKEPLIDQDLLEELVCAIVDQPDKVRVSEHSESDLRSTLTIEVDPADLGKIIGKNGRHIDAIRLLFSAVAAADGRTVLIELNEPRRQKHDPKVDLSPERRRRSRFRPRQASNRSDG